MTPTQRRARQRAVTRIAATRAAQSYRYADAGQFAGAKERPNTRGWGPRAQSPNADTVGDQQSLRSRGRDAERNFALAASAMITFDTCVIGTGLRPMPRIDYGYLGISEDAATALSSTFMRHYTLWANSRESSFDQSATFGQQQRVSLAARLLNGDHWVVFRFDAPGPYGFALQHIEADLVRTPPRVPADAGQIVDGVEFDGNGVAIAIHVAPAYPDDLQGSNNPDAWVRVPIFAGTTRVVLHQCGRRRAGQARGTTIFAPVLEDLKGLTDFSESALTTAINDSIFTGIFKTPRGSTLLQNTMLTARDPETGALIATSIEATGLPKPPKLGSGNSISMYDDETYEAVESKRPSPQFDPFWSSGVKRFGAGIGLPPELILRAFTASFSASKGAVNEGFRTIYSVRGDEETNLCNPVYEMFFTVLQLRGILRLPRFAEDPLARAAYLNRAWSGPIPGSMNPLDEARAAEIRLDKLITTHEEETADYSGESWESNHAQQVKEHRAQEADRLRLPLAAEPTATASRPAPEPSVATREEAAANA